jgi:hypothetical protein
VKKLVPSEEARAHSCGGPKQAMSMRYAGREMSRTPCMLRAYISMPIPSEKRTTEVYVCTAGNIIAVMMEDATRVVPRTPMP